MENELVQLVNLGQISMEDALGKANRRDEVEKMAVQPRGAGKGSSATRPAGSTMSLARSGQGLGRSSRIGRKG